MGFIEAHRDNDSSGLRWGVEPICRVLEVAPSTYYDAKGRSPSERAERDRALRPKLRTLWEQNYSVYGRRKLTVAARRAGLGIGRDQVARLMRAEGIRGAGRARKLETEARAMRALAAMSRGGEAVNFVAVARKAAVSTDFLYRHPTLRARVVDLRRATSGRPPPRPGRPGLDRGVLPLSGHSARCRGPR